MMILPIEKKYRVTIDEANYILQRKNINAETKKEYWVNQGYYACMDNLFEDVLLMKLGDSSVKNIKGVLDELKQLKIAAMGVQRLLEGK